ncbi:MAG: sodium:alanine symporter family protein [Clostridia bacterium]|nr:sodium:alanine symporter family protein [Clostridia bacterium]
MIDTVKEINNICNIPAVIIILGVGLFLTIRMKFIQIRKFGFAMKETAGKFLSKKPAEKGAMTPFQALCTALAATIGTGNVAGVAGAIALGGPGAVFWMWISAMFGMCTKFTEVTLAVRFRERNSKGNWVGGPMYYIKNGLGKKWMWLAYIFCVFGSLCVFGTGNATQVNTIVTSINSALSNFNIIPEDGTFTLNLIFGIVIAVLVAVVLLGGIKRLGAVTETLVPFMSIVYILLGLGVVVVNIKAVPYVFSQIFEGAFNPKAVTGGMIGSVITSMSKGVSRGIFSNEAGLGTAPIAHSTTSTKDPVQQGLFGIFEVFISSIIICTLTALTILCSGISVNYGSESGAELTINGLVATYGGWVSVVSAVALCCFAFSTVLGWGLYGTRCIEFMFGSRFNKPFLFVYSAVAILGATMKLDVIWGVSDIINCFMSVPNLIAVALLSPEAIRLIKEYFERHKHGISGNEPSSQIPDKTPSGKI